MVSDVPRRFVIFMGYVGQTTCGDPKTNSTERIRCFQFLIIHNIISVMTENRISAGGCMV